MSTYRTESGRERFACCHRLVRLGHSKGCRIHRRREEIKKSFEGMLRRIEAQLTDSDTAAVVTFQGCPMYHLKPLSEIDEEHVRHVVRESFDILTIEEIAEDFVVSFGLDCD
jgi:hypothetical protein